MKKLLILVMLPFSLCVHAQIDSTKALIDTSQIKFIEPPDSTGFGTPGGHLVSQEIGPAGGIIVSDDGRVELIFPADALTANTTISIQPITNLAPNGAGKAYKCEPSGIQFKKPVQFFFHYTKQEAEACPADLMNLASQDDTGKWTFSKYENWDSTKRILKGSIHHFSSVGNSNGVTIRPDKTMTIAEGRVNINFYDRYRTIQSGPFLGNGDRQSIGSRYWAVNGIRDGNQNVGYAGPGTLTSLGAYTAPKVMPKENPVTINLFFEYYSEILEKDIWGVVSCKILVYDEYKVEVTSKYTGRAEMHAQLFDKAWFVVRIFPNSEIGEPQFEFRDKQNYPPGVIKEGKNGPFKEKIIAVNSQGHIDISSHKNDKLSYDYPPKASFDLNSEEVLLCEVQYKARGLPAGPVQPLRIQPIPEQISFIANGESQLQRLSCREIGYEVNVTPHREQGKK
jgi:hypothetical protein